MNSDFLSRERLEQIGFADLGEDVLLHSSCVIVGAERISIGSHVRIDPFCILTMSGHLQIGSRVHLSGHVAVLGGGRIEIGDFAAVSHGAKILSSSDSFSAGCIVGGVIAGEVARRAVDRQCRHSEQSNRSPRPQRTARV